MLFFASGTNEPFLDRVFTFDRLAMEIEQWLGRPNFDDQVDV